MSDETTRLVLSLLSNAPATAVLFVVWFRLEKRLDRLLDAILELLKEKGTD